MEPAEDKTLWKALPPLTGGVWVGMVTEVLDGHEIPNIVSTDLSSGGLGMIVGTTAVGKPWRIKVPEEYYDRALEIFDELMGDNSAEDENSKED